MKASRTSQASAASSHTGFNDQHDGANRPDPYLRFPTEEHRRIRLHYSHHPASRKPRQVDEAI